MRTMVNVHCRAVSFLVLILGIGLLLATGDLHDVEAGNNFLYIPFNTNSWSVTQTYYTNNGSCDPFGGAHCAWDIAGPSGADVVAAAEGKVITHQMNDCEDAGWSNYVEVQHSNGYTTYYAHLASVATALNGKTVPAGTKIGVQGECGSATGPHVHFEVHDNGYANPGNPASCTASSLWIGCPRADTAPPPLSSSVGPSIALNGIRIGAIGCASGAYVKEGTLSAGWTLQAQSIKSVVLSGNRIGVLTDDGNFYVKEGTLNDGWTLQRGNTIAISLSGNRIGALGSDGYFYVKEGSLTAGWSTQRSNTKAISLDGDRIGALENDGTLYVKEGSLIAGWTTQRNNTKAIALSGDRIGALENDGNFYVKEGSLIGGWTTQHDNTKGIALNGEKIGALTNDGNFWAKEGGLNASWSLQFDQDVRQIAIDGGRMGGVRGNGDFFVKDDSLGTGWTLQMDHVRLSGVNYSECPPVQTAQPTPTPAPTPSPAPTPTPTPTPAPADADGDGVPDYSDNCPRWANAAQTLPNWTLPSGDSDCDGYGDTTALAPRAAESTIGTVPTAHCSLTGTVNDQPLPDAWPPDFNDNQLVNGSDLLSFNNAFGKHTTDPPIILNGTSTPIKRFDLNGSGLVNGADVLQLNAFFSKRCV